MANASIPGITAMTNAASIAFKTMLRVKGTSVVDLPGRSQTSPAVALEFLKST